MAFVHIATPYTMAVVRRQYIVWLKLIWSSLAIIIANPILFLFAFTVLFYECFTVIVAKIR